MQDNRYTLIVIGAGASGMMASILSARQGHSVLLLEKLPKIGAKLKATGGGRCNLTNTLSNEDFMVSFGREGRFMTPALEAFDHQKLQEFFKEIGVETHAPDGFRVFPIGHNSSTIIHALKIEMERLKVKVLCSKRVEELLYDEEKILGVLTTTKHFYADNVIIATGGRGYPMLGAEGDGFLLAKSVGHKVTELYPAMMPLKTKERWGQKCRADTLAKVELRVDIKKYKKLHAIGDLIFTKNGIRGPVVLDFSREITPLLSKFEEVPLLMNMTKGMNEEQIRNHFKQELQKNQNHTALSLVETLLPKSVSIELCNLAHANLSSTLGKLSAQTKERLIKLLVWTPLTINGHDGFKMAMITRGGVSLKEINPNTMQSKKIKGLYFCGEVMNLDGPCGGYNLQWAFASGYLAGINIAKKEQLKKTKQW
ncbi:MAG: NAD(P)/FAD-dependent oxidoreductase [Sulfurovum sp.]|nr:MAG: NAD(P)/FAD-dependent oxidoreductase [Sulfurovum sp.]